MCVCLCTKLDPSRLTETLARRLFLLFTLYGRLFIVFLFAHIAENIVLLAFALKAFERAVERLVITYVNDRHRLHHLWFDTSKP